MSKLVRNSWLLLLLGLGCSPAATLAQALQVEPTSEVRTAWEERIRAWERWQKASKDLEHDIVTKPSAQLLPRIRESREAAIAHSRATQNFYEALARHYEAQSLKLDASADADAAPLLREFIRENQQKRALLGKLRLSPAPTPGKRPGQPAGLIAEQEREIERLDSTIRAVLDTQDEELGKAAAVEQEFHGLYQEIRNRFQRLRRLFSAEGERSGAQVELWERYYGELERVAIGSGAEESSTKSEPARRRKKQ